MRVGQLSTMAGAMAERWMSASDCVAQRLQPLADARCEHRVVEEHPGLVEDEEGRTAIELRLEPVEQVGQHRQHHAARVKQVLHLERLQVA